MARKNEPDNADKVVQAGPISPYTKALYEADKSIL